MIRSSAVAMLCFSVCALPAWGAGAEEKQSPEAKIAAAYKSKYNHISTILVETSQTTTPLVSDDEWFRELESRDFGLPVERVVAIHHDGRFYSVQRNQFDEMLNSVIDRLAERHPSLKKSRDAFATLPGQEIRDAATGVRPSLSPNQQSVRVQQFDGRDVWQSEPNVLLTADTIARHSFTILDPSKISPVFPDRTLLDHMLLSFPLNGLPRQNDERSSDRVPDLWVGKGVKVENEAEIIEGARCIVLAVGDRQRISFDPTMGFAVRRRQWFIGGNPVFEFIGKEYVQLAEHLWLPKTMDYTQFGWHQANDKFLGKPVARTILHVARLEINRPEHLDLFEPPKLAAGNWVVNYKLPPLDAQGNPVKPIAGRPGEQRGVSYVQPANQKDLDKVVESAQKAAGGLTRTPLATSSRPGLPTLIVVNAIVIAALAVAIGIRRFRKRS